MQPPEWFPESMQEQPRALRNAMSALRRDRVRRRAYRQRLDPAGDPLRGLAKLRDGPVGGVSLGHVVGSLVTARCRSNMVASGLRAVSLDLVQDLAQMPEFLVKECGMPIARAFRRSARGLYVPRGVRSRARVACRVRR